MAESPKRLCPGTGQPAVKNADPDLWVYPTCPECGRDFSHGRRAGDRNYWRGLPRHFVTASGLPSEEDTVPVTDAGYLSLPAGLQAEIETGALCGDNGQQGYGDDPAQA
jgi:hypothetical protein